MTTTPRTSLIERQSISSSGDTQIIAANVDYGLIVQAVDRDFSINRLERYLAICHTAKITPIVILSKVDLLPDIEVQNLVADVKKRLPETDVMTISFTNEGYQAIDKLLIPNKTYCLLGSSGVGKSTLLNHLLGNDYMKTAEVGAGTNRGKHTTSHRELVTLSNGSVIIDNPGIRSVGITDVSDGMDETFEDITRLSTLCRFSNCTHQQEVGCAVLKALDEGEIDKQAYANYQKMMKEKQFFESTQTERKHKDKQLGKLIKGVKNKRSGR